MKTIIHGTQFKTLSKKPIAFSSVGKFNHFALLLPHSCRLVPQLQLGMKR